MNTYRLFRSYALCRVLLSRIKRRKRIEESEEETEDKVSVAAFCNTINKHEPICLIY